MFYNMSDQFVAFSRLPDSKSRGAKAFSGLLSGPISQLH